MLRSMREPPDTTTQARRSSLSWRSVLTRMTIRVFWSASRLDTDLSAVLLAGDGNDKGTAGADGTYGECVQSRHPSHHLFGPTGLCSSHSAGPLATRHQEEEKCHPEVCWLQPLLYFAIILLACMLATWDLCNKCSLKSFYGWNSGSNFQ